MRLLLKDKAGAGSSVSVYFLITMIESVPLIEPEEFDVCPVLLAHPEADRWTPVEFSRLL